MSVVPVCVRSGSLSGPTILLVLLLLLQVFQDEMVQVVQEASLAQARGHRGAAADVGVAGVQHSGEVVLLTAFGVGTGSPRHMGL